MMVEHECSPPISASHGGDSRLFDFAPRQTHSAKVGEIGALVLETSDQRQYVSASELETDFTFSISLEVTSRILDTAKASVASVLAGIEPVLGVSSLDKPRPSAVDETFVFELPEAVGEPRSGDPAWWAETLGGGEAANQGIEVTPLVGDPPRVQVDVAESVVGDVVLFASYASVNGTTVFANPILVTQRTSDQPKASLELEVGPTTIEVGTEIGPVVYDTFTDGSRIQRWATADNLTAFTFATSIVDVSNPLVWKAIAPGRATVTVEFENPSNTANVIIDVVDPVQTETPEEWLENTFYPEEIDDPLVVGDDVDIDGDGLNTLLERLTGGSPRNPNPEHLPQMAYIEIDGVSRLAFRVRISNRLNGESAELQSAVDLESWTEIALEGAALLASFDRGDYTEYWFDVGGLPESPLFYRLVANPDGN